jgi:CRISPR/Cas system CMR-associated protein Cmr1 (group 7 of RAMP superfamily)
MYKHYLTIELSVDDFVDDYVSKINSKSKNSIRINQENFRKVFDEEMD